MKPNLLVAVAATFTASLALSAAPAAAATPCFGAAARDVARPCTNPTLSIFPALKDVDRPSESPCAYRIERSLPICTFGTPKARSRGTIALLGDSHSWHLRGAVDVVAKSRGWLGYSVTAPGCSFSPYVTHLPATLRHGCVLWYARARAWLRRHREVRTVFMSQLNAEYGLPGVTHIPERAAAFVRALRAMPLTVTRVVMIKDVPDPSDDTLECVARVVAAQTEPAGPACATPQNVAITQDAGTTAIAALRSKRYQSVDLTQYFCDGVNCFPVIGGALVYRDTLGHLTPAFSKSLGPFLLRKVQVMMLR